MANEIFRQEPIIQSKRSNAERRGPAESQYNKERG
jgi:hypothetical protein